VVAFLLGLEGQRSAFLQHDLRAGGGGLGGTEIEPLAKLVAIEHRVLLKKKHTHTHEAQDHYNVCIRPMDYPLHEKTDLLVQVAGVSQLAEMRGKQRLCPYERLVEQRDVELRQAGTFLLPLFPCLHK
jgi:hypothetical protein